MADSTSNVIGSLGRLALALSLAMPFRSNRSRKQLSIGLFNPAIMCRERTLARYTDIVEGRSLRDATCAAKAISVNSDAGSGLLL